MDLRFAILQNATGTPTLNLVDIITVVVAISSSLSAVFLTAYLGEYFRDRRERKRARGMVIAYVDLVYDQMPSLMAYVSVLSARNTWEETTLPQLYRLGKTIRLVDTSFFEKVRERLLNLDFELAVGISVFDSYVRQNNDLVEYYQETLSEDSSLFKDSSKRADTISGFLQRESDFLARLFELDKMIMDIAKEFRVQLLRHRKKVSIDFSQVSKKSKELQETLSSLVQPIELQ